MTEVYSFVSIMWKVQIPFLKVTQNIVIDFFYRNSRFLLSLPAHNTHKFHWPNFLDCEKSYVNKSATVHVISLTHFLGTRMRGDVWWVRGGGGKFTHFFLIKHTLKLTELVQNIDYRNTSSYSRCKGAHYKINAPLKYT